MDPAHLIIGFVVGFLIGLSGVGGGAILTPLLIFSGVLPMYAVGSSLVYASLTKSLGSVLHHRKDNIEFSTVKILLLGSVPASFLGILLLNYLKSKFSFQFLNAFISSLLAIILILVAIIYFSQIMGSGIKLKNPSKKKLILAGFIVGITVQLTSVGSGVLVTLFLLPILVPRKVVGTDVFHAFVLTSFAGMMQFGIGNVLPSLVLVLLIGSIPGVVIGVSLSSRIPIKPFHIILTFVIFFSGLLLLLKNFGFIMVTDFLQEK
ncbi:MAG: sulfite exporter TauE/SafE family protein [Candidatus Hydrothermarchaeota archaeon]